MASLEAPPDLDPEVQCYRCGSRRVYLMDLSASAVAHYADRDIVMSQCLDCGLEQRHPGKVIPAKPFDAIG